MVYKHFRFALAIVALHLLISFSLACLSHHLLDGVMSRNTIEWRSLMEEFCLVVVVAPLLETLIFQLSLYDAFQFLTKKLNLKSNAKDGLFIISASLVFSAFHNYNWLYHVSAFLGGICLNYAYLYFTKANFYPYWSVTFIHCLYNFSVFLIRHTLL